MRSDFEIDRAAPGQTHRISAYGVDFLHGATNEPFDKAMDHGRGCARWVEMTSQTRRAPCPG
eukprot:757289-Hanusia_phi.AAC.1